MSFLLNPRVLIALALFAFLGFTHLSAYRAGQRDIQNQFDAYKGEQAQLTLMAEQAARQKEKEWAEKIAQTEEVKNEEIRSINGRLDAALDSLRNRPARSPDVSKSASACKGATGASLSAEDSRFLARESARADSIRAALQACYAYVDQVTAKEK